MALYIDQKFILLLSPKLKGFRQVKTGLYNFKCVYCGDSKKNASKTRGYIYAKGQNYFYTCFNCNTGTTLRKVIEYLDPYLAKEYVLDSYRDKQEFFIPKKNDYKPIIPKFSTKFKLDLPTIKSLDDSHVAKQYIINRKIPEHCLSELYYAEDFKEFVETLDTTIELKQTSPRIVIPFWNKSGELIALQGRAVDSVSMRYITIKLNENYDKIFGAHKIDQTKSIYVVEGPFDSMFIPNCIATADSNLSSASNIFDKSKLILIPDREPRNKNIVNNIEKFISQGYSVCLLPDKIKQKDINDIILYSGLTNAQLFDIIQEHTFSGLRAKVEFSRWRKI